MIRQKTKTNSGFMALISAIIISIILLLIATNLSLTGFYSRSNILDSELKERSLALAEACADTALLKLANDPSYSPADECIPVDNSCPDGPSVCIIQSILNNVPVAGQKTIEIQTNYKKYFTNLEIVIDSTDLSIQSWKEEI